MFNIKLIFCFFIFLLLLDYSNAQDSTSINNIPVKNWGIGTQFGISYPLLMGKSDDLISNELGYFIGVEADFRNVFAKFNIAWLDSKVENSFLISEEWPKNLPLDALQLLYSVGYKINIFENFYLNPMLSYMMLVYHSDDRVEEFTNISRNTDLNYYGFSIGMSYNFISHSPIFKYTALEISVGFYEPFNSKKKIIFPSNALNLSSGIIFYLNN